MSEELRHKLIHYEAPPPDAVWNAIAATLDEDKQFAAVSSRMTNAALAPPDLAWLNIAARLDDDKQYNTLEKKLHHFEETPPSSAWEAIAARLDDDKQYASIATKINTFEAMPPRSSWDNIAATLNDSNQYNTVATKFKNFEAVPPPLAWNNIAEALTENKEEATPVINIRKIIYRLAAAAIFTGVIIGGFILVNKNTKTDFVKNNKENKPAEAASKEKHESIAPVNPSTAKTADVASLHQPIQDTKEKSHALIASIAENGGDIVLKHAVVNDLLTYQEKPIVIHSSPILDREGNLIADMDVLTTSNYIVIMGPNGQTTRISAKFASVIRYLDNNTRDDHAGSEEYLDRVIKESDTWKKRFQEWRSKISQSSFIPSASNFLDIVEFKELIEEKK